MELDFELGGVAQRGHRALTRALVMWVVVFLLVWCPVAALTIAWTFSPLYTMSEPAWSAAMGLPALELIVLSALAGDISARLAPRRQRVLYLRKFNFDAPEPFKIGPSRWRAFALSDTLNTLGIAGVLTVGLRDSRTPGSKHISHYMLPVVAVVIMFWPPMLGLYALFAGLALVSRWARLDTPTTSAMVVVSFFVVAAAVACIGPVRRAVEKSLEWSAMRTRALVTFGWRTRNPAQLLARLEKARSVGPIMAQTRDADWISYVRAMMAWADAIVFDVRGTSGNCDTEIGLLRDACLGAKTIWVLDEPSKAFISVTGADTYEIRGMAFPGKPLIWPTPLRVRKGVWSDDHRLRGRMAYVLHMLDRAAPLRETNRRT